ncbi:MAG TPA: hypothetical protein VEX68_25165, partial [Bryobacteraceae bacterium]|nr:hypothetical protein [Bryobacteraceae bacterium]
AFAARSGPGANWCTYATWASRQAGCTIRGEDLIERLHPDTPRIWRTLLRAGVLNPVTPPGWIVKHVHTPFDAVEHASRSVAKGNLKVFEEIGEVFARNLEDSSFEPGPPPLREAFAHYRQAEDETNPNTRACLMLFGNLKCGWHEQTRLQPEIAEAIKAPLQTTNALTRRFLPILRRPLERLTQLIQELNNEIVTQGFMTLKLPMTRLQLGKDIDRTIPSYFDAVEHDPFLLQFSAAGHGGDGAENWSDLSQRMRYISRLFRCFHEDNDMFLAPLTSEQCKRLYDGRLPRGTL